MEEILNNAEFQKLKRIGGHKVYHLEGDAYTHTLMVIEEAKKMFPDDPLMWKVAALHDIGKIYTSIQNGPDDWCYPDHAECGSFKGILCKFIPLEDPDFVVIQWYIRNHIKPLFWEDGKMIVLGGVKDRCSVRNLARLAVCDIRGSKSIEDQSRKIEYLMGIY